MGSFLGRLDVWRWSKLGSMMQEKGYEKICVVCEQLKDKGIYLYTSFICTECEKDIISTDTSDPQYKFFLKKLRKITSPEIYS